jgi:hypothetical protein
MSKTVPIEEAKTFCEKYEKDQCIILCWDKTSGEMWVTTYGVGDPNSIQAAEGGRLVKDFLKLKRENDEIPERFKEWKIESVDRYYHFCNRYQTKYVETTYWYEPHTLERKETTRIFEINYQDIHKLPDWAKSITQRRNSLDFNY